jgi:glycosyltransferase involved in cell wall biosynthesis
LPNRLKNNPILSKALFKNAYKNIAPSLYTQSNFEKYGFTNIVCISNSIKLKNYPFKQRTYKAVKLLWVRSFSIIYNPLLAIKILKLLLDEGLQASLCMVGPDNDGSLWKAKKYAEDLNIEVTFTGKLSKKEWIKLSEDYNFFINTTNFDNMPVSVIEAMALGLPIISTNVGGMSYLIENNEDGILVNPNDAVAFVEAIKRMQTNTEFTTNMALKAGQKVKDFDWELVKKQWVSILQ